MQQSVLTSKALEDESSIKEQCCTWAHLQGRGKRRAKGFDDPGITEFQPDWGWREIKAHPIPALPWQEQLPVPHCSGPH